MNQGRLGNCLLWCIGHWSKSFLMNSLYHLGGGFLNFFLGIFPQFRRFYFNFGDFFSIMAILDVNLGFYKSFRDFSVEEIQLGPNGCLIVR